MIVEHEWTAFQWPVPFQRYDREELEYALAWRVELLGDEKNGYWVDFLLENGGVASHEEGRIEQ